MDVINPYSTKEGLKKLHSDIVVCDFCGREVRRRKDELRGEYVCPECGFVFGQILMYGHMEVILDE